MESTAVRGSGVKGGFAGFTQIACDGENAAG